jgi:hypothetical protein
MPDWSTVGRLCIFAGLLLSCSALSVHHPDAGLNVDCGPSDVPVDQVLDFGVFTPVRLDSVNRTYAVHVPPHNQSVLIEVVPRAGCTVNSSFLLKSNNNTGQGSDTCALGLLGDMPDFVRFNLFCELTSGEFPFMASRFIMPYASDTEDTVFNFGLISDDSDYGMVDVRVSIPPPIGTTLQPTVVPVVPATSNWLRSPTWYSIAPQDGSDPDSLPFVFVPAESDDTFSIPFLAVRADCGTDLAPSLVVTPVGVPTDNLNPVKIEQRGDLTILPLPVIQPRDALTGLSPGSISAVVGFSITTAAPLRGTCFVSVDAVASAPAVQVEPQWWMSEETTSDFVSDISNANPDANVCGSSYNPVAVFELVVAPPSHERNAYLRRALDRFVLSVHYDPVLPTAAMRYMIDYYVVSGDNNVLLAGETGSNILPQCSTVRMPVSLPPGVLGATSTTPTPATAVPSAGLCLNSSDGDGDGLVLWAPKPGSYYVIVHLTPYYGYLCPTDGSIKLTVQTVTHQLEPTVLTDTDDAGHGYDFGLLDDRFRMWTELVAIRADSKPLWFDWVADTTFAGSLNFLPVCWGRILAGDPAVLLADPDAVADAAAFAPLCLHSVDGASAGWAYPNIYIETFEDEDILTEELLSHDFSLAPGIYAITLTNSPAVRGSAHGTDISPVFGSFNILPSDVPALSFVPVPVPSDVPTPMLSTNAAYYPTLPLPNDANTTLHVTFSEQPDIGSGAHAYALLGPAPSWTLATLTARTVAQFNSLSSTYSQILDVTEDGGVNILSVINTDYTTYYASQATFYGLLGEPSPLPVFTIVRDPNHAAEPMDGEIKFSYETTCIATADDAVDGYTTQTQYTPYCACSEGLSGHQCADIVEEQPLVPEAPVSALIYPGMTYTVTVTADPVRVTTVLVTLAQPAAALHAMLSLTLTVIDPQTGLKLDAAHQPVLNSDKTQRIILQPGLAQTFPDGLLLRFQPQSGDAGDIHFAVNVTVQTHVVESACPDACSGHGVCVIDGETAAATCSCAAGYVLGTGLNCASRCPSGQLTVDGIVCEPCPPASAGSNGFCTPCARDWVPSDDATACVECPEGYTTGGTDWAVGMTECVPVVCAPGQEVNGHYCATCPPGSFSADGATCDVCPAGTFAAHSSSAVCDPCAAGSFSAEGSTLCQVCPTGSFSNNGASCDQCPPGSYSNNPAGATKCTPCAPGSFQADRGQNSCVVCSPGSFSDAEGATGCQPCQAGWYQDQFDATSCIECPAGDFDRQEGAVGCSECLPGTYAPVLGETDCLDCPVGTFAGAAASATCTNCLPGTYMATTGASECLDCPAGTYQDQGAAVECLRCPAGSSSGQGSRNCPPCPAGMFSDDGAALCLACPPGSTSAAGDAKCSPCPVGSFSADGTKCTTCPAGSAAPSGGSSACVQCVAGTYSAPDGSTCVPCPSGTFSDANGATACRQCLAGTFAPVEGATACVKCPAGTFSTAAGASECHECPPGSFSQFEGAVTCTACAAGQYIDRPGSQYCIACPAGSASDRGSATCTLCPAGSYSAFGSSPYCLTCPAGSVSPKPGASGCQTCLPGSFAAFDGLDLCAECPEDTFASGTGTVTCAVCHHHFFSGVAAPGSTACPVSVPKILLAVAVALAAVAGVVVLALRHGRTEGSMATRQAKQPLLLVEDAGL